MDSEQLTAIADDLDDALTADASVGDLAAIAAGIPDAVFQYVPGGAPHLFRPPLMVYAADSLAREEVESFIATLQGTSGRSSQYRSRAL
jgi:hypothetical protein